MDSARRAFGLKTVARLCRTDLAGPLGRTSMTGLPSVPAETASEKQHGHCTTSGIQLRSGFHMWGYLMICHPGKASSPHSSVVYLHLAAGGGVVPLPAASGVSGSQLTPARHVFSRPAVPDYQRGVWALPGVPSTVALSIPRHAPSPTWTGQPAGPVSSAYAGLVARRHEVSDAPQVGGAVQVHHRESGALDERRRVEPRRTPTRQGFGHGLNQNSAALSVGDRFTWGLTSLECLPRTGRLGLETQARPQL